MIVMLERAPRHSNASRTSDLVSKFTMGENVGCMYVFILPVRCSRSVLLRLLSNALLVAHFVLPKSRHTMKVSRSHR